MTRPNVTITSKFWTRYQHQLVLHGLPYQWDVLNDNVTLSMGDDPSDLTIGGIKPTSHAMANLRIAAGLEAGEFSGRQFQDSDVYKWLESACYALRLANSSSAGGKALAGELRDCLDELSAHVEEALTVIAGAQEPDGYLDTKFQLDYPPEKRFSSLRWSHELYVMGHLIEACVAHHEATGADGALAIACRVAECIDEHFGDGPGQVHGPDGHPEVELALARLYEATGERRWLDLAAWFIRVRGTDPDFLDKQGDIFYGGERNYPNDYHQMDRPATELEHARGHCVRLEYLAAAMAKVGRYLGDEPMLSASRRLWDDVTHHQMYVTGNVGTSRDGECFTYDDDLSNMRGYGETCASVAMCFWAEALMAASPEGSTADVLELELFNGMLAGLSLDTQRFFYVNVMEADPVASQLNPDVSHVSTRREEWFDCACCPANATRLIMSLDRYLYTVDDVRGVIYAHQFISNEADFGDGLHVSLVEHGQGYPWDGRLTFTVSNPLGLDRTLAVRVPAWARSWGLRVNGEPTQGSVEQGFLMVDARGLQTVVELELSMPVRFVRTAARVRENAGLLSVARGPVVYCMEGADNHHDLWTYRMSPSDAAVSAFDPSLLGGIEVVTVGGAREVEAAEEPLYAEEPPSQTLVSATLRFVPYYAWCNRDEGQMRVWVVRKPRA